MIELDEVNKLKEKNIYYADYVLVMALTNDFDIDEDADIATQFKDAIIAVNARHELPEHLAPYCQEYDVVYNPQREALLTMPNDVDY